MDDPFNQVRTSVASNLQKAERQHVKWGEARRRKPVRHDECKSLLIELLSLLDSLEGDLDDLEGAVGAVEKARARFSHVDDAELEARRNFVRNSKRSTASIREDVSSHTPMKSKRGGRASSQSEREGLLASPSAGNSSTKRGEASHASPPPVAGMAPARDVAASIDAELGQHAMMQQAQLDQQDETLDVLHGAVGRLKSIGQEMNDEINSQNRMLGSLGDQLDTASSSMAALKSKMSTMMSKKDRGKFCAILVLSVVLLGLTWLVVNT